MTVAEVRFSPYNSPFIPANGPPGVIWVGLEYRDAPHNAHVYTWTRWRGQQHVAALHAEMTAAVALLPLLDECADEGIKASARRAKSIRKFLNPSNGGKLPAKVLAKVPLCLQRESGR